MDEIQEIVKEKKIPYYNDLAERANYDREAFSELYDHFFPRVYNWLFGKMMDRDAADDVVSVSFEKMMLNLSAYDKRKAAFSTWLFRIASNAMTDYYRKQQRRNEATWEDFFEPADDRNTPEQEYLVNEGNKEILVALDNLSEREKDLIIKKFWGGMSNKEIAEQEGMTASNVGVILHRAMGKLRNILEKTM